MNIINKDTNWRVFARNGRRLWTMFAAVFSSFGLGLGLFAGAAGGFLVTSAQTQQSDKSSGPVIVQPGAPGQPSKRLPASTTAKLLPLSPGDVEFMQGMIMHHAQAVEMTALIASHTDNEGLQKLGSRISSSQTSEINFMKRWLATRGQPLSLPDSGMKDMAGSKDMAGMKHADMKGMDMKNMDMTDHSMPMMPGMLTPEQMDALRKATGAEFDHLFLTGMIQHHNGALTMVKDLFNTAGAGQDAEIFDFATDADNTQRAEIGIMQTMLEKKSPEGKR
jgi:uncharacterized protein (DUF305 family)